MRCALHVVRTSQRIDPGSGLAQVARKQRQVDQAHNAFGALRMFRNSKAMKTDGRLMGWFAVALAPQTRSIALFQCRCRRLSPPVPNISFIAAAVGVWQTRAQQSTLFVPITTCANFCVR